MWYSLKFSHWNQTTSCHKGMSSKEESILWYLWFMTVMRIWIAGFVFQVLRSPWTNTSSFSFKRMRKREKKTKTSRSTTRVVGVFFIFVFFKKKLQKYIFGFRFYSFIPLPPGRGAAGGLPQGREAAGSLLKYKTPPLPSAPSFSAHEIQRGERETGGVREVKKPAKPCRILDPNRR